MIKEIFTCVGGVVVATAIVAIVKYQWEKGKDNEKIERIFVDELNIGEIKGWFSDKIADENQKGILFEPTKENVVRWNMKIPEKNNTLIQAIYDTSTDSILSYREIVFSTLSKSLKELLVSNNGAIVIEK